MTKIRIAINGFGRIGRITARMLLQRNDVELVAVNDLADTRTLAHLFKYDSIHGVYKGEVSHDEESLHIDGHTVKAFAEKDPSALPWGKLGIDVVVESSVVGVRKPDPRFYELACERLAIEPSEAVFLDDLGINLKPARAMGMATIKVGDPAVAIAELEQIVGFPLR